MTKVSSILIGLGVALVLASCNNRPARQEPEQDSFFAGKPAIPPFSLVDQSGRVFTQDSVAGKVYVADFFFTSCKTICPKMTEALELVQRDLSSYPDFRIVSHTLDPRNDSVARLKAYGELHGAKEGTWYFLTGERSAIYGLANDSYKMAADGNGGEQGITHSSRLILVGRDRVVVDYYDAEDPEEVKQLVIRAKQLLES
jgi:protein SCO1/2